MKGTKEIAKTAHTYARHGHSSCCCSAKHWGPRTPEPPEPGPPKTPASSWEGDNKGTSARAFQPGWQVESQQQVSDLFCTGDSLVERLTGIRNGSISRHLLLVSIKLHRGQKRAVGNSRWEVVCSSKHGANPPVRSRPPVSPLLTNSAGSV